MLTAAFGRLCVETFVGLVVALFVLQPPSGGCVLKLLNAFAADDPNHSRLRAAVC